MATAALKISMSYENKHRLKDGDIILYTRNGSPTFHARLKIPKVKGYITKSTGHKDLEGAIRFASEQYDDLRYKARHGLEVRTHTFDSVYRRWLEANRNRLSPSRLRFLEGTARRYFIPFFGEMKVENILDAVVEEYWKWRVQYWTSSEGVAKIDKAKNSRTTSRKPYKQKLGNVARIPAPKSLEMEQSALRQILKWAHRVGIINRVPEIKAPRPTARREISRRPAFSREEWVKLTRYLGKWWSGNTDKPARLNSSHLYQRQMLLAYILFMGASGLRPNEARQLRWKDITTLKDEHGITQTVIHVAPNTKTGERQTVSLLDGGGALAIIQEFSDNLNPNDYIFSTQKGAPIANFGKTFKTILVDLGILRDNHGRTRTIYSLRHTYATLRLLSKSVTIEELASNMGTSPEQIFKHYRHITNLQKASQLGGDVVSFEDGIVQ